MSTAPSINLPLQNESKSAKKKKARAEAAAAVGTIPVETPTGELGKEVDSVAVNGTEGSSESPFIKELTKNIRNLKKKLVGTQKTDSVIAENPGKSLDQLLAERKINADQKAQVEKKPALQSQLEQYETQLENYKKFEEHSKASFAAEKASLERAHYEELERVKEETEEQTLEKADSQLEEKLLSLSRFLRTAASKRSDDEDHAPENVAFEGALLLIYGGDQNAVTAMVHLINGSEEVIPTVEGQPSGFSYKLVRDVSIENAPPLQPAESLVANEATSTEKPAPVTEETAPAVQSDPTVANAGLTELSTNGEVMLNGDAAHAPAVQAPEPSSIDAGAANAVAEAGWDNNMSQSMTSGPDGFEMVEVPRDPAETDTGLNATLAAATGTQSWAEDVPTEPVTASPVSAPVNDGFHEVHHGRGRGRGGQGGEFRGRGRGRGDGYRGRGGFRGDRGGRGRGPRGDRGRGRGGGPSNGYNGGDAVQS